MAPTTTSFLHSFKLFGLTLFLIVSYHFSQAQIDSTHFVSTWFTYMSGSSNYRSITIYTHTNHSYNYDVDWNNDGVFEDTNLRGNITHQYPTSGVYTIRIKGVFPRIYFGDSTNSSTQNDRLKLISIDQWGTQEWENFSHAFHGCELMSMNATDVPNLDSVKDLSYAFANVKGTLNSSINHWDVSSVKNMEGMFYQALAFNSPIGNWDVSSITNMSSMFEEANVFNQPIGNWIVSNVTDMHDMFRRANAFNQPIGNWNVGNVRNMEGMFAGAAFNQNINNWNVGNVRNMKQMFEYATSFNHNISNWNVSNVRYMNGMFQKAISFNQNLGNWSFANVSVRDIRNMFDSCGLSTANYDSTLMGWQAKPHPANLELGAANISYCASDSVRNLLITNSGWSFVGDTFDCVTVGIEQKPNTESSFKVYPNPTQGQLTIESTVENMNIPLFIYNTQGQRVKSIRINKQNQLIELDELPAGLYLMVQGESRQKIVLEK